MASLSKGWDTAVVIGSGPSLTQDQITEIYDSGCHVIAVNDNYKLAPWADVLFACDIQWWYYHKELVPDNIECWTIEGTGSHFKKRYKYPNLNEVPYIREFDVYDDKVHHGGNSGYIAIQLARLFGAKKIILVGFDHMHTNGKVHWFGDHDKEWFRKNAEDIDRWLDNIERLLRNIDVDVVNCSNETAITTSRRSRLEFELT